MRTVECCRTITKESSISASLIFSVSLEIRIAIITKVKSSCNHLSTMYCFWKFKLCIWFLKIQFYQQHIQSLDFVNWLKKKKMVLAVPLPTSGHQSRYLICSVLLLMYFPQGDLWDVLTGLNWDLSLLRWMSK